MSSNIGNYFYYKLWGKKLVSDENVAVIIGCWNIFTFHTFEQSCKTR